MSFYTDWVLAPESDAEAVASTVTEEERSLEEWPHLSLRNIGQIDLQALWAILRQEPQQLRATSGALLYRESEEGPFVCRVQPAFVEALTKVDGKTLPSIAAKWHDTEGLSGRPRDEIEAAVRALSEIAKRSSQTKTPILDLMVM